MRNQWDVVAGMASIYYNGIPLERIELRVKRLRLSEEDEDRAVADLLDMAAEAKHHLNEKLSNARPPVPPPTRKRR